MECQPILCLIETQDSRQHFGKPYKEPWEQSYTLALPFIRRQTGKQREPSEHWKTCYDYAYWTGQVRGSIAMSPYEALYGRPCRTPLCWTEVEERRLFGPGIIEETLEKLRVIRANMKKAQDLQMKYAD